MNDTELAELVRKSFEEPIAPVLPILVMLVLVGVSFGTSLLLSHPDGDLTTILVVLGYTALSVASHALVRLHRHR